jgi:uncharacterized protein YqjF (DUF2071 family)
VGNSCRQSLCERHHGDNSKKDGPEAARESVNNMNVGRISSGAAYYSRRLPLKAYRVFRPHESGKTYQHADSHAYRPTYLRAHLSIMQTTVLLKAISFHRLLKLFLYL